ncbi:hypothetical protein F5Y09DRAFT_339793 [Xylaria sp. FL1042]|nr:hypothetical protein F5Y09DRAFT_339793 [Xylaria sp. FL1042]
MNHSTRLPELRQLVFDQGLSREEIRYLRLLLSDTRPDPIGELPLEIIALIVLHLSLKEFACCLRMSKVWRERFLSQPVMAVYAERHWPAMINGAVNRCNFLGALSKLGWGDYGFKNFYKYDAEVVPWDRTSQYELDSVFHNQLGNLPDAYTQYSIDGDDFIRDTALYTSGKVAYHLCGCIVVVDDLKSNTRKVLTPPSGMMYGLALKLHALGSRLVVGSIDRLLVAWDHVNNRAYEKSLPSRVLRCTTRDDRVGIVRYGGDVLIWTPGHAVLQLDLSSLTLNLDLMVAKTWRACLQVFFDARDRNILYLATGYFFHNGSNDMVRLEVHVFSVAGHAIATWSFEDYDLYCKKMKSGLYTSRGLEDTVTGPCIEISEYECDKSCIFFTRPRHQRGPHDPLVVFNKRERKFSDLINKGRFWANSKEDYLFTFPEVWEYEMVGADLDYLVSGGRDGYCVRKLTR